DRHLALVGLLLAGDHSEQRGLAGPVGTDEADLLPLQKRRGGLNEEKLVAILLADVVETNHGYMGPGERYGAAISPCGAHREARGEPSGRLMRHRCGALSPCGAPAKRAVTAGRNCSRPDRRRTKTTGR